LLLVRFLAVVLTLTLMTSILANVLSIARAQMGALDLSTGATGLDIGTGGSASSILPIFPIFDGNFSIGNGTIRQTIKDLIEFLESGSDFAKSSRELINSRSLDNIQDAKCIADGLTGGTGIKERGRLIIGTNCNDKIKGNNKAQIIYTLAGTDRVFAKGGNDIIYGGPGTDRLYGEKGDDIITAGAGGNLADGGPGNDVLAGGAGNDLLVGGGGNDQFLAGLSSTIMEGGKGSNSFDCGLVAGKTIVLDYNPDNGDTIAGQCKIVNNIGTDIPNIKITPP
jgi:Ca2+-binding RTX toxin-like protein